MALIENIEYPEHLYYDIENQIWYEPLADGTARLGYTPVSMRLMGDVLAFTPKRVGREFKAGRSFAIIEGGKWVAAAEAAFDGCVVAANEELEQRPGLLNRDAFGKGWMLIVRPSGQGWREGLVTGPEIGPRLMAWIEAESYKGEAG